MKSSLKLQSAAALVACAAVAASYQASAAIMYNPVVTMVGDGAAPVSGQARTTTQRIYLNTVPAQVLPISELAFPSGAASPRLVNSISATSEGMLSNNPGTADAAAAGLSFGGTIYTFSAGYDAANGTGAINSTATNANRVAGYMNATSNTLSAAAIGASQTQASAYDNNNVRGATGDDSATNFWLSGTGATGSTGGWRHFNSNTQVTTTNSTNVRTVEIRNNQLFGTTGAGTTPGRGLYMIGSPPPTTSGNVATQLIATGAASSPYEFVLVDDPNNPASTANTFGYDTAYIADDSVIASNGGIQKWIWNGAAWSNAYTLNDSVNGNRGLAGQLDSVTGLVTLWATTADGTKLMEVTDHGSVASSPFITLATAPTNNVFRGVALSTAVPEPTTFGAIGLIALAALRRRRSR